MITIGPTEEFFKISTWHTPAQVRDLVLTAKPVTESLIRSLKRLEIDETCRRKSIPSEFVKCIRCYGYHGQNGNIDQLCERCESATAPLRYDLSKTT